MVKETISKETIRYATDPEKYMRVLDMFIKNNEMYTNVFTKTFLQQVAIIASLMIAIIPISFASASISINLLTMAQDYISSGGIINIISGVIILIPIFLNLTLSLLLYLIR
jgi:hypothetical protein